MTANQRVILVFNDDAEPIPPFGVAQVNTVDSEGTTHVGRVTKDGSTDVLVNGPTPIPGLAEGQMYSGFPAHVYCSSAPNQPQVGEIWGTKAGEWGLRSTSTGFVVRGLADGEGYALVDRMPYHYLQMVKVLVPAGGGNDWSIGVEQVTDPGTGLTSDGAPCRVRDANRGSLQKDRFYLGKLIGLRNRVMSFEVSQGSEGTGLTDEAGHTLVCAERDEYGAITDVKIRTMLGRMLRCVTADDCCLPNWWCISNQWLSLASLCCDPDPFEITRIVAVAISNKTGVCTDLPNLVFLVYSGEQLIWDNCGGQQWGLRNFVASLEITCSGGDLTPAFSATGFTRDDVVSAPIVPLACVVDGTEHQLGTFNYHNLGVDACGREVEETGTADFSFASYVDGLGDPITGAVAYGENEVPPCDANGYWKTEEEAESCCVPSIIGQCGFDPEIKIEVKETLRMEFRNRTGDLVAMPDHIMMKTMSGNYIWGNRGTALSGVYDTDPWFPVDPAWLVSGPGSAAIARVQACPAADNGDGTITVAVAGQIISPVGQPPGCVLKLIADGEPAACGMVGSSNFGLGFFVTVPNEGDPFADPVYLGEFEVLNTTTLESFGTFEMWVQS